MRKKASKMSATIARQATWMAVVVMLSSINSNTAQLFGPSSRPPLTGLARAIRHAGGGSRKGASDVVYGKPAGPGPIAADRSGGHGGGIAFDPRLPNILDATVDSHVPTLPFRIPVQSNIRPDDFLRKYQQQERDGKPFSYGVFPEDNGGGHGGLYGSRHDSGGGQYPVGDRRRQRHVPNALDATAAVAGDGFRPSVQINSEPFGRQQQQGFQQQAEYHQQLQQQQQQQQFQQLVLGQLRQQEAKARLVAHQHQLQQQQQQQRQQQQRQHQIVKKSATPMCDEKYAQLVGDIFMGNELVPEVLDQPPEHLLELTYRTVRTFPGMRVTADVTRFNPMVRWPAEEGALYSVVLSNLDINSRRNRSLSEFWHWFVGNVPETNLDRGEVVFDLLHPLVLPDGDGDHRYGYFVMKQPGRLDFSSEGGPTPSCSTKMSAGRGPYRSVRDFMKKYKLELTAATFLVVDHNDASEEIACEWQKCMKGTVFLEDLDCDSPSPRGRRRKTGGASGGRKKKGSFWYL